MIDTYTKVVLTVIAAALVAEAWIAVERFTGFDPYINVAVLFLLATFERSISHEPLGPVERNARQLALMAYSGHFRHCGCFSSHSRAMCCSSEQLTVDDDLDLPCG